jgi:hypothetical protein
LLRENVCVVHTSRGYNWRIENISFHENLQSGPGGVTYVELVSFKKSIIRVPKYRACRSRPEMAAFRRFDDVITFISTRKKLDESHAHIQGIILTRALNHFCWRVLVLSQSLHHQTSSNNSL